MNRATTEKARQVRSELEALRRGKEGYQDPQRLILLYAIERFLYRLGRSAYANQFVLKGAMLLAVYVPDAYRTTKDADLLGYGTFTPEELTRIFDEVCGDPQDDGLTFNAGGMSVRRTGKERPYPGYEVTIPAWLGEIRCPVSLDIGFGETVVPAAQALDYPTLLKMPRPRVRVYPLVTIVAEKFQAIVHLGMSNTRLKDYHDLFQIASHCGLDGNPLCEALGATFKRRSTAIPIETPIGLRDTFYRDKAKQKEWQAFLKLHNLPKRLGLEAACRQIEAMVMPAAHAAANGEEFIRQWTDATWQEMKPGARPRRPLG